MFTHDLDANLDQELSEIPPEYQEAFRQAMARELADMEQNRTDSDILRYLRQRREDFRRGSFIRPDGRPGLVALSPEAVYEQALPQLAQSSRGDEDQTAERRRLALKLALFAGVTLLFLFLVFRGRVQREAAGALPVETTPTVPLAAGAAPTPTLPLPEITGVDDSLQTIGSLGGALTIGRPSAIELHYSRSEETVALAIDPSRPTTRGELRFNEAAMLSTNPVAVWIFGTVLNYAVGIPDSLVRNLTPGDRLTLSTDTGAALDFVVIRTGQGSSYDAGRLLSQNRLGLTLFALPAVAEDDVAFALAQYDITAEDSLAQPLYAVGEPFTLADGRPLEVGAAAFNQTAQGDIRIVLSGLAHSALTEATILLSLTAGREQTMAVPLTPAENGTWQATFVVPGQAQGAALIAEFRALPAGSLAVVRLGEIPHLVEQLASTVVEVWPATAGDGPVIVAAIQVNNPGEGAVYLDPDFIRLADEGGDAYGQNWQVTPRLPLLINPGETLGLTVTFPPPTAPVRLQIGRDLWEIGLPVTTSLPAGRRP